VRILTRATIRLGTRKGRDDLLRRHPHPTWW
jgi:hypothetical protein